ncbi:MAG: DUF3987 domain-containing protein [Symploca sp. SIO2G7]|nr:DUF3987 domain-containing protein [Symploca sp. SIO2G7]
MATTPFSTLQKKLLAALSNFPEIWALTPVDGKKAPYRPDWQNEEPLTRLTLVEAVKNGEKITYTKKDGKTYTTRRYPKGFGLRTGVISGGIVAIDADGHAAHEKILELNGGKPLPDTVSFTSDKPGRCQYLFYIPPQYWSAIKTIKIKVIDADGNVQFLEFRWDGCQSVLPPSAHPETGHYRWVRSPLLVEVAIAPLWVIEQMLAHAQEPAAQAAAQSKPNNYHSSAQTPHPKHPDHISIPVPEAVPLLECCRKEVRNWVNSGVPKGSGRNDIALEVGQELVAVERHLNSINQSYTPSGHQLFSKFCHLSEMTEKERDERWQWCEDKDPNPSCTPDGIAACIRGWYWRNYIKPHTTPPKSNATVTSDSDKTGDRPNPDEVSIAATVNAVTDTLNLGLADYEEQSNLESIQKSSVMSKDAFWKLVAAQRCQLDEVQPEDEERVKQLIDWSQTTLDFHKAIPSMADDLIHDGNILNTDPIGLWQYLLPTVLSLVGLRVNFDVGSHSIPTIAWTCLVAESGQGKTRAEKVILAPLKKLQAQAKKRFLQEMTEWEKNQSSKDGDTEKLPRPVEMKYLFEVATIQAVLIRLSEQQNSSAIWTRDELIGLFKSLGQFGKKEQEALECLLKLWDGDGVQVDRVLMENSFLIEQTRLSLSGGIQPGIFTKMFTDPTDPQGLQARFLFALLQLRKPKRVKGFCQLSEKLPEFYEWLQNCPEGTIRLSHQADKLYDSLYDQIGEQAYNTKMPAIRAWMFKLPSQLLRITLALHLIEYYHDRSRNFWEVQVDTLKRAVLFAQYYRNTFQVIQEKAVETDDISSILLKVWDSAVTNAKEGITPRDAYRAIKAIQSRAKAVCRSVSNYTIDLFFKLQQMGKGKVVKQGRLVRFFATGFDFSPPPSPPFEGEEKTKYTENGDRGTIPQSPASSDLELSPQVSLSTVTVGKMGGEYLTNGAPATITVDNLPPLSVCAEQQVVEKGGESRILIIESIQENPQQMPATVESPTMPINADFEQRHNLEFVAECSVAEVAEYSSASVEHSHSGSGEITSLSENQEETRDEGISPAPTSDHTEMEYESVVVSHTLSEQQLSHNTADSVSFSTAPTVAPSSDDEDDELSSYPRMGDKVWREESKQICTIVSFNTRGEAQTDNHWNISTAAWKRGTFVPFEPSKHQPRSAPTPASPKLGARIYTKYAGKTWMGTVVSVEGDEFVIDWDKPRRETSPAFPPLKLKANQFQVHNL